MEMEYSRDKDPESWSDLGSLTKPLLVEYSTRTSDKTKVIFFYELYILIRKYSTFVICTIVLIFSRLLRRTLHQIEFYCSSYLWWFSH